MRDLSCYDSVGRDNNFTALFPALSLEIGSFMNWTIDLGRKMLSLAKLMLVIKYYSICSFLV
jgi:hypothetical protein